jgi:hypothetical protein
MKGRCGALMSAVLSAGRHIYNLVTGFALLYYVFGTSTLFLLVPAALTYLIMLGVRESCATLVWLVVFSTMIAWCALAGLQEQECTAAPTL